MVEWVSSLVERFGYGGVALLMCLENIFPPIPSEVIMPLAGVAARRQKLDIALLIVAGTLGSAVGFTMWYGLARMVGERRLGEWVERHGRWAAISGDDVDRAASWLRRHGVTAVGLGRVVPAVRTLVSIPAGFSGMQLLPFLFYSLIGSAVWTSALAWGGYLLGGHYDRIAKPLNVASWAVMALLVGGYLWRVIRQPARRRRRAG